MAITALILQETHQKMTVWLKFCGYSLYRSCKTFWSPLVFYKKCLLIWMFYAISKLVFVSTRTLIWPSKAKRLFCFMAHCRKTVVFWTLNTYIRPITTITTIIAIIILHVSIIRRSAVGSRTFTASGASVWNDLPAHVTAVPSLAVFRQRLKIFLFSHSYPGIVI